MAFIKLALSIGYEIKEDFDFFEKGSEIEIEDKKTVKPQVGQVYVLFKRRLHDRSSVKDSGFGDSKKEKFVKAFSDSKLNDSGIKIIEVTQNGLLMEESDFVNQNEEFCKKSFEEIAQGLGVQDYEKYLQGVGYVLKKSQANGWNIFFIRGASLAQKRLLTNTFFEELNANKYNVEFLGQKLRFK